MDKKTIEKTLFFHNSWWKEKKVPEALLPDFERFALKRIKNYLEVLERIIIIKGPRRTGKTTLLYQVIASLLKQKKDPFDILFLSFDDPSLRIDLEKIFEAYQDIRGKVLEEGQIYCFLDEVHFLDNWQFVVKKYFDKKYPIKFLISSSSASLFKKGLESLTGRTIEEIIFPLSFKEFVFYHFRKDKHFLEFFKKRKPAPYQDKIKILFNQYLSTGGFPHILSVKEPSLTQKLLREDVLEKVIYRDLIDLYGIREPRKLERMFLYLTGISGQILSVSNLAKNIGLTRVYTENYIVYLEKAYLIFRFENFSLSFGKRAKGPSKVYLTDTGLVNLFGEASLDFALETAVAKQLFEDRPRDTYYFRDKLEVDFILKKDKKLLPIEVKNKTRLENGDFKGLIYVMKKFKIKKGLLLCQNIFKEVTYSGLKIKVLPIWYWLLFGE